MLPHIGSRSRKIGSINLSAWSRTLPDLLVMIIVSTMDCVLKIHATSSKLPLQPDSDREAFKFGLFNYILAACGAACGYMQLKFNVISLPATFPIKNVRGFA